MLGIVGILPYSDIPVMVEKPILTEESCLIVKNRKIPIERGTSALIASAMKVLKWFEKNDHILCFLVGDIGKGEGSKALYQYLSKFLDEDPVSNLIEVFVFHYILPDVDGLIRVLMSLENLTRKPFLIADAGFMYVVKMAGYSNFFDLFTPDVGELAFLADEKAPHPFYTRGFLLAEEDQIETLIERAYKYHNLPQYVFVKAKKDRVVQNGKIIYKIEEPFVPALEAIGGTGDTLTGIVSALIYCGYPPDEACRASAILNRLSGCLAKVDPSTQIDKIIQFIPEALEIYELNQNVA